MRVENIGLPGSGKSTLIRETMKAMNNAGHVALDSAGLDALDYDVGKGFGVLRRAERSRQAIHFARFMMDHADLYAAFQSCFPETLRSMTLIAAIGADLAKHSALNDKFDSFWADEGFLHKLAVAVLVANGWKAEPALKRLDQILPMVPLPDMTIYTEVTPEIAVKNVLKRAKGFGSSEKEARKRLDKSFGGEAGTHARAQVLDAIAVNVEARGGKLLRLEGQRNLSRMVFETVSFVAPSLKIG